MTNIVNNQGSKLASTARIKYLLAALLIFAVLYSLTNVYSAALFDSYPERINMLAITIDRRIPFIPAMIIPYSWSMILFIASFFMVCTTRQLSVLRARLIIATLLACLIFYLYPARFSFVRPLTSDWTAFGYQFLNVTDKPFNQLPSLHVSYALLLGASLWNVVSSQYKWRSNIYRLLLAIVCILIIVSTVFTYQHHLLDVVGGFVLAGIVLIIVHKLQSALVLKYLTVGVGGFLLMAIASFFVGVNAAIEYVGIILAYYWLASFMLLSWLYQVNNIKVNKRYFRKNSVGKLTLSTWIAFAPVLIAYKIMSHLGQFYFARKEDSSIDSTIWHKINDEVLVSASARLSSAKFIKHFLPTIYRSINGNRGADHLIVIDVAAEIDSHLLIVNAFMNKSNDRKGSTYYLSLPLLDLQPFSEADVPIIIALFKKLDQLIFSISKAPTSTLPTLINFHCVMGFSRSIAMQVLYLIYCDKLNDKNYRAWINQHYPNAHLSQVYLPDSMIKAIASVKSF